jgi:hypothetical protein
MKTSQLLIGVKIYAWEGDFGELFDEWRMLGINAAFVSEELLRKPRFRMLAQQYGVSVFVILPVFQNPEILGARPQMGAVTHLGQPAQEDWVQFVCPTRQEYRDEQALRIARLVGQHQPDGISLDFMRYFVYWEMVHPHRSPATLPDSCFDDSCLALFQHETGVAIPADLDGIPARAAWIHQNHAYPWAHWKCQVITSMVDEIVTAVKQTMPDVLVNLHAVPWRQDDFSGAIRAIAGQDFAALSRHVDFISPMCYTHMLLRPPAWVPSVVADVDQQARGKALPSIQVKEHYREQPFSAREFAHVLEVALHSPSQGVILWSWEALAAEPDRKAFLKRASSTLVG